MKKILILAFLAVSLESFFAFQKVSVKVKDYSDIFFTESGLPPLPENAVELEHEFSFESPYFQVPEGLASDSFGNIYVSDRSGCAVYKFNSAGEFLLQIGSEGRGKGRFLAPAHILAEESLIIHDTEKKSLEYMDFQGNYLESLKVSGFMDMVSDGNNLYIAPDVLDKKSALVEVYSSAGKRLNSFGAPLSFIHSMNALNSRSLAMNQKGELLVAFTYFPLVRKYSADGKLVAEIAVENLIMEAKELHNLKNIGEGIANPIRRAGYIAVIADVEAFDNKIYLLSYYPRLEILELDDRGKAEVTYWKDFQEIYEAKDLLVQEIEGEKKFYILKSFPNYDVDVFGFSVKEEQWDSK